MYKAPPVASRICQYKWEQHQNKKLAKRLKKVKASIDNKPPRAVPHLANKAKKEQEMELKYRKIEKANRLLLERMSRIMTTSTLDNKIAKRPRRQGVHAASRRAEAIRITRENQMLLKRIQSKKAFMSKKEWQRHHKEHKLSAAQCGMIDENTELVRTVAESIELNSVRYPCMIVSASGMASGGPLHSGRKASSQRFCSSDIVRSVLRLRAMVSSPVSAE